MSYKLLSNGKRHIKYPKWSTEWTYAQGQVQGTNTKYKIWISKGSLLKKIWWWCRRSASRCNRAWDDWSADDPEGLLELVGLRITINVSKLVTHSHEHEAEVQALLGQWFAGKWVHYRQGYFQFKTIWLCKQTCLIQSHDDKCTHSFLLVSVVFVDALNHAKPCFIRMETLRAIFERIWRAGCNIRPYPDREHKSRVPRTYGSAVLWE